MMSNDLIEENGITVKPIDAFENELKVGNVFILNTDLSVGRGIHYIVMYVYKPNKVFIIDSLGSKPKGRPYDAVMKQILDENNMTWKFYPYTFQTDDSKLCGYWAIWVVKLIEELKKHYYHPSPKLIIHELQEHFTKSASVENNKELVEAFGVRKTS